MLQSSVSEVIFSTRICCFFQANFTCTLRSKSDRWEKTRVQFQNWAASWQNQQNGMCAKQRQISLGICPVWPIFAVRMKKAWVLSYPLSTQQRLIRLGGCPGWSVSLDAQSFCWFSHEAAQLWMTYSSHALFANDFYDIKGGKMRSSLECLKPYHLHWYRYDSYLISR